MYAMCVLLVQYNFSSKVETVLLKCIFLSCWCHFKVLKLFGWLPEKFRKKKRDCLNIKIDRSCDFTREMLELNVFSGSRLGT